MKRFIAGEDRTQITLLPECLDDYIAEDNPIRVVEVFVDEMDLGALGFSRVDPAATGRPAYHPSQILFSSVSRRPGEIHFSRYKSVLISTNVLDRRESRNVSGSLSAARLRG